MNLDKILEIATECVENEKILSEDLTLLYKLDEETHKKLDEELFYKINNSIEAFKHNEVIEITIAGITFIFEIE
tara:strand:+ start:1147 stop:1368 length:222 start_codon:yes stop_codon:yes gene_type:complete